MNAELLERVAAAVDAAFDDQVTLTRKLVAEASLMGAEASAQHLLADAMAERGLEVDLWRLADDDLSSATGYGRPLVDYADSWNVVGTHRGSGAGRSLILNGHVDVVPTGPGHRWTTAPFEPSVRDGWLYGRGAGDMKAGLVANLFAWDAVRRCGLVPEGDLLVQSVVEEECTGNGTLACLTRGHTADIALITEPTQQTTVTAHVGLLWFRLEVEVDPQHAGASGGFTDAIQLAYELDRRLRVLEDEWNDGSHLVAGYETSTRPVKLVLGRIHGGDWPSSTPAWCTADFRIGPLPGVDAELVRRQVEDCVAGDATVVWQGHFGPGYSLTGGEDLLAHLESVHAVAVGGPLQQLAISGSSDARVFAAHGIPAVLYGPTAKNIHGYDEAVELESVRRITTALALFAASWGTASTP